MNLKIEALDLIGRNAEWQFGVARIGDRWLGVALESEPTRLARAAFASEGLPFDKGYMHVFAEVSEGIELGMQEKTIAMLLVGALAQDPEHGFGGIDEWLVPEVLRGDPEKFRCEKCGDVGCGGRDCTETYDADGLLEEEGDCE